MEAIFETNPVFLSGLLGDLKTGRIQLPDFQRGWVWEDERICGLLASVSRSFPIGALMMLETGGEARFHPRPVEGVNLTKDVDPELLVLDGQQRLTSLFQATTYGKVVATTNIRKESIKRWFYFDMQNFRLRDDWYGSAERKVDGVQPAMANKKVLRGVQNTHFLQAISLIHTFRRRQEDVRLGKSNDETTGVSCKHSAVLALPCDGYQALRDMS